MAESMKGLKRSHRCTEVSSENIGETVTQIYNNNMRELQHGKTRYHL